MNQEFRTLWLSCCKLLCMDVQGVMGWQISGPGCGVLGVGFSFRALFRFSVVQHVLRTSLPTAMRLEA